MTGGPTPSEAAAIAPDLLPRLVYFADVPVENYMHGSALIYRLLETYPKDRLRVVEGLGYAQADRRLPGIDYIATRHPLHRLMRSRFGGMLSSLYALLGGEGVAALDQVTHDFAPQAVLTVVHGYQWQTAAAFARAKGLPLHLIAHDRWQDTFQSSPRVKRLIAGRFAQAYREARSRLCVSTHMVEAYEAETGAPGEVLYPARRLDFVSPSTISPRVAEPGAPFTVAYAGSIADDGLIAALALTARALQRLGGRLLIFGPYSAEQLAARGLSGGNVVCGGSVAPAELAGRLRAEADLLAATVTFSAAALPAMEMNFPSKLTDYTAAGLPILVHGPSTSSAMRWANGTANLAATVDTLDEDAVLRVIAELMADRDRRQVLAETALAVGERQFSARSGQATLFNALTRH